MPGSKSIGLRALFLSALARGSRTLKGLVVSDDTQCMMNCLAQLGVKMEWQGEDLTVHGVGARFGLRLEHRDADSVELFVGNSGITSRFLLAALPLVSPSRPTESSPHLVSDVHVPSRVFSLRPRFIATSL